MKRFVLLLFLFCTMFSFAQSFSEKYNSILGRYEYYNSQGSLIGYKSYDSVNRQWNYTDITVKNSNVSSSINLPLIQQVMESRQSQYNTNSKSIKNLQDNIYSYFDYFSLYLKYPQVSFFQNEISDSGLNYLKVCSNYSGADLGNPNVFQNFQTSLKNIKREVEMIYNKIKHYERDPSYYSTAPSDQIINNQHQIVNVKNMGTIWDNPNLSKANNIGYVANAQVTIIEKIGDTMYKIKYGKIIGYMTSSSLFP